MSLKPEAGRQTVALVLAGMVRVGFRLQEEMFEAGIIRVGLDSQRTIIHPRAYRTEGIVIEGVHPVVLSESIGMGV